MNKKTTPIAVAVLLPVYNPTQELEATLESLRAQSVPFHLFLVDDGSKFHTDYEKLSTGLKTTILRLPENLGITGAMNAGLAEISKGSYRYVARIDSGDFCKPERFAKQLEYLDKHADIAILGSYVELRQLDENDVLMSTRIWRVPLSPDSCRKYMYFNLPVSHPALMLRFEVFEKLKGYSDAFPAAEDFDLMWRATKAGFNISNLDEILLVKAETPNSISQKRRHLQIHSRLRIQWANRDLSNPNSVFGMMRSLITLVAPAKAIHTAKKLLARS
jgi:GT2 family glycosyltransferase